MYFFLLHFFSCYLFFSVCTVRAQLYKNVYLVVFMLHVAEICQMQESNSVKGNNKRQTCSWSAAVSVYQKAQGRNRVMGGSLMHMGCEGWPGWSDPTEELQKLQKKFKLVLMERCQKTERGVCASIYT